VSLILPNSRAASTTNKGLAAGCYLLAMTLLAAGASTAALIGEFQSYRTVVVLIGFALVAGAGSILRFVRSGSVWVVGSATVIGVAGIAIASWQIAAVSSGASSDGYFFSALTIAAVALGALVWRSGHAALACTVALVITQLVVGAAAVVTGGSWRVDLPALAAWAVLFGVMFALERARRRARASAQAIERADADNVAAAERRRLGLLSTAVLHDTVLGDLTMLATTTPGELPGKATTRIADTVALLSSGSWLAIEPDAPADARLVHVLERSSLAPDALVLTGDADALAGLDEEVAAELLRALEQCLDNVARHASASTVEVTVMAAGAELSIMVSDDGVGFDPDAAAAGRLGVRTSIHARIAAVGGRAAIWSALGNGTTVLLTVPLPARAA
jgi:signal transduction histidine kinase